MKLSYLSVPLKYLLNAGHKKNNSNYRSAATDFIRHDATPKIISFHRFYCQQASKKCWNCKEALQDKFFCSKCNVLREPSEQNYFLLFDLKTNSFNIDTTELTRKFRSLQKEIHPDKFSQKSDIEQTHSLDWSSLINKAYKTLSVPLARAEYILKENNIELPQDNSSLDQEFLIDMMERNEEVEEASSKTDIDDLLATSKSDIDRLNKKLELALETNDFEGAKSVVVRIKYMLSIKNSILEKAARLGFAEVK